MSIAVIYGGTRENGNTELLTKEAVKGINADTIYLHDHSIQPIVDMRHTNEGFQPVNDDYDAIIERLLKHDVWIFSTPIYWYSMSGIMKCFIDRWSQTLRDSHFPDFKNQMQKKKAYVVAVGGDEPYIKGLPMIQQFQHIFNFMGMNFQDYIIGSGNKPGDILQDKTAFFKAQEINRLLKESY